ncbi:MAG: LVIVD repeat-containing protein [Solirubrobacterales bacterium]
MAVAPFICVLAINHGSGRGAEVQRIYATPFGGPVTASASEPDGPATPTDYGDCGAGARPESGLQGQVPLADQVSGRAARGYRCNLRQIGSSDIGLRGQNFQLAWYRDCAYVSTIGTQAVSGAAGEPDPALDGIAALDVSDPRAPELVDVVKSPVAKSSHEAIEVSAKRGLLVTTQGGLVARYIEVYGVSRDCRHPTFLGRYDAGIPIFHGLKVSDDGKTVYATDTFGITGAGQIMHAVDISDPRNPTRLLTWDPLTESPPQQYASHDLDINRSGNRLYLGTAAYQSAIGVIVGGGPSVGDTPSLAILDSSEVQQRRPDPDLRVLSTLSLPNIGHTVQQMRIGGKPYLLVSGEAPVDGARCPWAWGHIVDIADERRPRRVSDLRLEVNRASNCPETVADKGAIYSIHYVGVDRERDTRYVFYTYYTGGMRVFDVRDPAHPKEVAYFHSPATPGTKFPPLTPVTPDANPQTTDLTTSMVRFRPATGEIWVVSVNSGFQVLKLSGDLARRR